MNWNAVKPLATVLFTSGLKVVGASLVTHGVITAGAGLETFTGAAMAAGGALWSWWVESGNAQAAAWLKHLTETATQAAAVQVAKRMNSADITGAVQDAKLKVAQNVPAPSAPPVVTVSH
jgi:hypothetical protein